MVYTKHFVIHTFDKLNNACSYIENAEKLKSRMIIRLNTWNIYFNIL